MKMNWIILLGLGLIFSSCEFLEKEDDDDGPSISYDCEFTTETTYNIGEDPTIDFNVYDVSITSEILASTCDGVYVGDTSSDIVDSIVRSGSSITMTDEGVPDSLAVNGAELSYPGANSAGECLSGTYVFAQFLGGEIVGNTLVVRVKGKLDFDYCSSFVRDQMYRLQRPWKKSLAPFI